MKKAAAALSALVTALSGALSAAPAVTAHAAGNSGNDYTYDGYTVSYRVADAWGDTERIAVTLTNTGAEALENWMLYFDPNGSAYGFNGIQKLYTASETAYFRNAGYNDSIAPGESTTFEYLVDHCEAAPERFSLCQTRTEKTGGYEVSLTSYSAWGSNFNGVIHIHNTSDQPICAWELTFDTNYTITAIPNSWAAEVTTLGVGQYLMKGTYNDVIAPGETVALGFIAEQNGTPVLDSCSLTEITADEAYVEQLALGENYSLSDLEELNDGSVYPLEIEQDDDGNISLIDGRFSNVIITDGNSAMDSLIGVQELLGISSISNDLVLYRIYVDPDGDFTSYYFNQVYQGIPVFGRTVTVVAGRSGEPLSVSCGYHKISGLSADWVYSAETVAAAFEADTAEGCIYASGAYADAPVPAYLVMNSLERCVVSAATMQVLDQESLVYDAGGAYEGGDDTDFEYPDKPGVYFHRRASFYTEPIPDEAAAKALALSQPLGVDFTQSLNTLSDAHLQITNYETGYHFDQCYNNVTVFGREVLVAAKNEDHKLYSFESNIVEIPDGFSTEPSAALEAKLAELKAEKPGILSYRAIYTWDNHENDAAPRLAYICNYGDTEHTYIVFENEVWEKEIGAGLDEGCFENIGTKDDPDYQPRPMKLHYFPASRNGIENHQYRYKLSVPKKQLGINDEGKDLKIEMRLAGSTASRNMTKTVIRSDLYGADNTYFYAPQAVSAYVNLIYISQWYAFTGGIKRGKYTEFGNDAMDIEKGDLVCAIDSIFDPNNDNAASCASYIYIGVKRRYPYTMGESRIVLGHEFTHGVFGSFSDFDAYYFTARGINEGYADTFGELLGGSWDSGYEVKGNYAIRESRSARNVIGYGAGLNDSYELEPYNLVPYISRPAYLLASRYGFSSEMLAALYFKALAMGSYTDGAYKAPQGEDESDKDYNWRQPERIGRGSTLSSFRNHLLRSAKAQRYTNEMIQAVVSAINDAWGTARKFYETDVMLIDAATNEQIDPSHATVTFHPHDPSIHYDSQWSPHSNYIAPGYYSLFVSADGFIPYRGEIYKNYEIDNYAVRLVRSDAAPGALIVCAHDFVDKLPRDCTVIINRMNLDGEETVGSYQTGAAVGAEEGYTAPITLTAGYYTVSVEGASNCFQKQVYVAGGTQAVVPVHYYDVNVNQNERTDIFHFDLQELKEHVPETGYPTDFTLTSMPRFDHVYDPTGQRILYTTTNATLQGRHMQVYCYDRRQESFDVYLELSNADVKALTQIAAYDAATGVSTYSLEIDVRNQQLSTNKKTLVLTAAQLRETAQNYHNKVKLGTIHWKLESGGYVFDPVYYA